MVNNGRSFRIVHPFHPFFDKHFEIVNCFNKFGTVWIKYLDANERFDTILASWTDIMPLDSFMELSKGRAFFRTCDLLELVELIKNINLSDVE